MGIVRVCGGKTLADMRAVYVPDREKHGDPRFPHQQDLSSSAILILRAKPAQDEGIARTSRAIKKEKRKN